LLNPGGPANPKYNDDISLLILQYLISGVGDKRKHANKWRWEMPGNKNRERRANNCKEGKEDKEQRQRRE
jgi:hypothetical protein